MPSDAGTDASVLIRRLKPFQVQVNNLAKLLRELESLERTSKPVPFQIEEKLGLLERAVANIDGFHNFVQELRLWTSDYSEKVEKIKQAAYQGFGIELERILKEQGLSLTGNYPELKTWLFTIELDFTHGEATLWYGPRQERLSQCRLLPHLVAQEVNKQKKQLGSNLGAGDILPRLLRAYERARLMVGAKRDEVPINEVLIEMAFLVQESRFRHDPRRDNYRSYGRADFSYDLFRARTGQAEQANLFTKRLRLITATRALTKRRQDFLWIPDDETGKGTVYSHLKFEDA